MANVIIISLTDCEQGQEAEFNRWYDDVWLPHVMSEVPSLVACTRYEIMSGPLYPAEGHARFLAVYEADPKDAASVLNGVWECPPPSAPNGFRMQLYAGYLPITERLENKP